MFTGANRDFDPWPYADAGLVRKLDSPRSPSCLLPLLFWLGGFVLLK